MTLHFIEHRAAGEGLDRKILSHGDSASSEGRVFNVLRNGKTIVADLNILK